MKRAAHPVLLARRAKPVIETLRYGVSSPVSKASESALISTFFPYLPSHQNGRLTRWSAYFTTGGAFKIAVLRLNGYSWDKVYLSSTITASAGVNTYTAADFGAIDIRVGDIVGFYCAAGKIGYSDSDGFGVNTFSMSGEPTATGNVLSHSVTARNWQMSYSVQGMCAPSASLFDETFGDTSIPWDWEHQAAAWTYDGTKATSGTAGNVNSLNYRFAIGNLSTWTWTTDFTFDTSDAILSLVTRNVPQTTCGFYFLINRSTGELVIYRTSGGNGWDDAAGVVAVDTKATGLTLSTATTYRAKVVKSFRSASVTITDVATPANTYTWSWDQDDFTVSPTRGFGYGKPAFIALTGTVSILSTSFVVPTAQPDWLFIGDSITEGSGLTATTQMLPRLVAASRNVTIQTSAQGGAGTLHTPKRLAAEIPHIRPKNVHFLIGTNDTVTADWQAKMAGMRDLMTGLCSGTVRVGAIPAEAADTNPELVMNPYIIAQGWATVRHDLALTSPATGLGANRNASLYYDTLHPNASGHAAMAARFAVDV